MVIDPLAEVVSLLQPGAPFSKVASGAGRWSVRRPESGRAFYCVVMEGGNRLEVDGHEPLDLEEGHFVLIPSGFGFTMSSRHPSPTPLDGPSAITMLEGEVRHGDPDAPPNARLLIGHFVFGSPDAALLVSLLPEIIHVRSEKRLSTIVQLVTQEARELRPAREVVLAKLLEVMLIEALRSTAGTSALPGLLRGLSDPRLAGAIRRMHEHPAHAWTVVLLSREAGLSRSVFFERFNRVMGMSPMEYLLSWRMALAKDLLRHGKTDLAEVAERIGYGSASSFSVAFTRFVGLPPSRFAKAFAETATIDDAIVETEPAAVA
jgi:AraC-like DNA-binding protein